MLQLGRMKLGCDVLLDAEVVSLALILGEEARDRFRIAHDGASDKVPLLPEGRGCNQQQAQGSHYSAPRKLVRSSFS